MWIIILIIGVIVYIVYRIHKNYIEHVQTTIGNYGGMLNKYAKLMEYLKTGGFSIQKVTKDSILLSSNSMTLTMDVCGDNLEIKMNGCMPLIGHYNKTWKYPHNYSQEIMICEIETYLDWQIEQLKRATKNNPYKHRK